MSVSISLIFLMVSFALAASLWLLLIRYHDEQINLSDLPVALIAGPLLLSFVHEVTASLGWFGAPSYVLTIFVLLIAANLAAIYRNPVFARLVALYYKNLTANPPGLGTLLILAFIGFGCVALFLEAYLFPLTANDPLEYATSARLIYQAGDLANYPYLDAAQTGGYYGPWSHPLGYVMLMTWGFAIQDTAAVAGVVKFITPYFAIASVLLVLTIVWEHTKSLFAAALAALALLYTPIFFLLAMDSHVDPIRLASMVASVYLFGCLMRDASARNVIAAGLVLGMALYSHSINVVLLPLLAVMGAIYILASATRLRLSLTVGVVMAIGLVPVLPRFWSNLQHFGNIIADAGAVPLWQLDHLHYETYFKVAREISTVSDRVINGFLKPFSDLRFFGLWALILILIAGVTLLRQRPELRSIITHMSQPSLSSAFYWALLGIFGMMFLSLALNLDVFIKNARYMLTIQPLIAIVLGFVVNDLIRNEITKRPGMTANAANWLGLPR